MADDMIDTGGIMDSGAAGAAGAVNGLWKLVAMRRQAQLMAEAQRRYDAEQAQRQQQNTFEQRRLDQADQRQAKLDARTEDAAKSTDQQKLLGQVTQFPGSQVSGTQLESMGVGKTSPLRGSQFKNLEEALGGKALAGMSGTAGTPQQSQGEITATPHAAVGPDMFEVKPTFTEEMKTAAGDLAQQKADIMQKLGEAKDATTRQHYQDMLEMANQRAANAETRRNTLTPSQTLSEIGSLNKAYNTNTKSERTILQNYQQLQQAIKSLDDPNIQNQTAATKTVIDSFEKSLNPGGIVRQTAFTQDVGHQSLMDSLWGRVKAIQQGGYGMTKQNLQAFGQQVEPLARAAQQKLEREKSRISGMASSYSLPLDQVFAEEDNPFAATPAAPAGGGTPNAAPIKISSIKLVGQP